MEAGRREFDPRPEQYSRMSSSPNRQLVRFSHLNVPFFLNSEFIWNIVLVGKQATIVILFTRRLHAVMLSPYRSTFNQNMVKSICA